MSPVPVQPPSPRRATTVSVGSISRTSCKGVAAALLQRRARTRSGACQARVVVKAKRVLPPSPLGRTSASATDETPFKDKAWIENVTSTAPRPQAFPFRTGWPQSPLLHLLRLGAPREVVAAVVRSSDCVDGDCVSAMVRLGEKASSPKAATYAAAITKILDSAMVRPFCATRLIEVKQPTQPQQQRQPQKPPFYNQDVSTEVRFQAGSEEWGVRTSVWATNPVPQPRQTCWPTDVEALQTRLSKVRASLFTPPLRMALALHFGVVV